MTDNVACAVQEHIVYVNNGQVHNLIYVPTTYVRTHRNFESRDDNLLYVNNNNFRKLCFISPFSDNLVQVQLNICI